MHRLFEHPLINIDFLCSDPKYYEQQSIKLREIYLENHKVTQEDLDRWGDFASNKTKIGDSYISKPTFPIEPMKAYELHKNFFAYEYFLGLVENFLEKNLGKWNRRGIEFELERQNEFIQSTEKIEPSKAFERRFYTTDEDQFVKHRDGYFETYSITNSDPHTVYATYFLFHELLKFKLRQQESHPEKINSVGSIDTKAILKPDFVGNYHRFLDDYIRQHDYYTEMDFINKCELDFTEYLKDAQTKLDDPQFDFTSKQKMQEAPNFLIRRIKENHKKKIVNYKSILRFLEERRNFKKPNQISQVQHYAEKEIDIIRAEIDNESGINGNVAEIEKRPAENDLLRSTIEDYLHPFKEDNVLINDNYERLVQSLLGYIKESRFPTDIEPIKVGRTNKKRLGWAINCIFKSEGIRIDYEFLLFIKQSVSIYAKDKLDEKDFRKGNLYKNFHTNTK